MTYAMATYKLFFIIRPYREIREGIIRCILATDMARHNEILTQFREIIPVFDYNNASHKNLVSFLLYGWQLIVAVTVCALFITSEVECNEFFHPASGEIDFYRNSLHSMQDVLIILIKKKFQEIL